MRGNMRATHRKPAGGERTMISRWAHERVLVVDDEPFDRDLIARMVSAPGYEVETAAGPAEARECLAVGDFALVICDLAMPDESGENLVRWIRAEHPGAAVL